MRRRLRTRTVGVGCALLVIAVSSCARAPRVAATQCDGRSATPRTLEGDLHVVYGDGPTFHLVMGARAAELRFDLAARDTLLALSRRRVTVEGAVTADSAMVCDARIRLAGTDS